MALFDLKIKQKLVEDKIITKIKIIITMTFEFYIKLIQ